MMRIKKKYLWFASTLHFADDFLRGHYEISNKIQLKTVTLQKVPLRTFLMSSIYTLQFYMESLTKIY